MTPGHDHFMDLALEGARAEMIKGGRPIYAFVVKDGEIVGRGPNRVVSDRNPAAHSEVEAMRDACSTLGTVDLFGATLYTTMEPCPACMAAIVLEANIRVLVLGGRHRARLGRKDMGDYSVESFLEFVERNDVQVVTGIREAECDQLRSEWFASISSEQLQWEQLRSLRR